MGVKRLDNSLAINLVGQTKPLLDLQLENLGSFGNQSMVEPYGVIELNAAYPISLLRDDTATSGSGTVEKVNSEYRLRHTTGGDLAVLESARRGRYIPGYEAGVGVGLRIEGSAPSGDTVAEWGYFDRDPNDDTVVENGALFGVDSGGFYVRVVRGQTEVMKVYQGEFNIDQARDFNIFSGAGSGFEVRFVYYGYGVVQFILNDGNTGDLSQRNRTLHTFKPSGAPLFENPHLQVGAMVSSSTGSDELDVFVGGRRYHILGHFNPQSRVTSETVIEFATSTTVQPVLTFRRKAGNRQTTIQPFGLSILPSTEDVVVSLRIGSDLTGASFGSLSGIPDDETSLEVDTSASAVDVDTGTKIFEGAYAAGQANRSTGAEVERIVTDVPDEETVTICVRSVSGTGTVTITGRIIEEF